MALCHQTKVNPGSDLLRCHKLMHVISVRWRTTGKKTTRRHRSLLTKINVDDDSTDKSHGR